MSRHAHPDGTRASRSWLPAVATADAALLAAAIGGLLLAYGQQVAPAAKAEAIAMPVPDYADEPTLPVTYGPLRSIFTPRTEVVASATGNVVNRPVPVPEPEQAQPLQTMTESPAAVTTGPGIATTAPTTTTAMTTTQPAATTTAAPTTTTAPSATTEPPATTPTVTEEIPVPTDVLPTISEEGL